jgi:hypothetical protein
VLILSVFIGLFIKILSPKEPQKVPKQISTPTQLSSRSPDNLKSFFKNPIAVDTDISSILEPDIDYFFTKTASPSTTASFFENINKTASSAEKMLMSNITPAPGTPITTPNGIILTLTDSQFHFLYPNNFIASLIDAQNFFIKEYDSSYEVISKIETDAQVRFIEEKIVATLLSANMITEADSKKFINTIRFTLPKLQLTDLNNFYGLFGPSQLSEFLEKLSDNNEKSQLQLSLRKNIFANLMEKLTDIFSHKAQAVCGYCSYSPECYQMGSSTPMPGIEVVKFACTCTGCLTSLGCLSSCNGQAAIYDSMTGICGCGL